MLALHHTCAVMYHYNLGITSLQTNYGSIDKNFNQSQNI